MLSSRAGCTPLLLSCIPLTKENKYCYCDYLTVPGFPDTRCPIRWLDNILCLKPYSQTRVVKTRALIGAVAAIPSIYEISTPPTRSLSIVTFSVRLKGTTLNCEWDSATAPSLGRPQPMRSFTPLKSISWYKKKNLCNERKRRGKKLSGKNLMLGSWGRRIGKINSIIRKLSTKHSCIAYFVVGLYPQPFSWFVFVSAVLYRNCGA